MADTNNNSPEVGSSIDQALVSENQGIYVSHQASPRQINEGEVDTSKEISTIIHDQSNEDDQTMFEKGKEERSDKREVAVVEKPTQGEVWLCYLYELCSFFIQSVVIPVLFPLLISDINKPAFSNVDWVTNERGFMCKANEMNLYEALTYKTIKLNNSKFSPLDWTSFSWALGLILVAPILGSISTHLDHGNKQPLIMAAAIAIGSFFCLPTGFFHVTWIFPPYIALIVVANTIATTIHTRQLGILTRGFIGSKIDKSQFPLRRAVSSWLALYATASGTLGSAIISAFTYYMLRHSERFLSLWVVSIFSGLKWLVGISHIITIKNGPFDMIPSSPISHSLSIFKYPHAIGSLIVSFLASFTKMSVFVSGVLFLIGQLCFKPVSILYLWLTYFLFPIVSLPLVQPLQHVLRSTAVKMNLLGFFLSMATCGVGFYFRHKVWETKHVFIFAAIESTSMGLLHAYGRVLHVNCTPPEKEGVFSAWLAWFKNVGSFAGFAFACAIPGNISTSFGAGFLTSLCGVLGLIYGNVSDFGGAIDAGLVSEDHEDGGDGDQKEEVKEEVLKYA